MINFREIDSQNKVKYDWLDNWFGSRGVKRYPRYKDYLAFSDNWQEKRKAVLERDSYKCIKCNSKEKLHVHHTTYENQFDEKLEDLITVCTQCHDKIHNELILKDKKKYIRADSKSLKDQGSHWLDQYEDSNKEKVYHWVINWHIDNGLPIPITEDYIYEYHQDESWINNIDKILYK